MTEQNHWRKIARYLAGEAEPDEERALHLWADSDTANRQILDEAQEAWQKAGSAVNREQDWDVDAAFERFRTAVLTRPEPASPRIRRREPTRFRRPAVRFGAGIAAALMLFFVGRYALNELQISAPAVSQVFETEAGQQGQLILRDGSRVRIGPKSRIEVPPAYGRSERQVHLTGRAFFDVLPDAKRPFIVTTEAVTTRVLGTRFGIRSYPGFPDADVVVESGRVQVRSAQDDSAAGVLVEQGQRARVPADQAIRVENVAGQEGLAWTEREIVFRNDALTDVLNELEVWFPVRFSIADPDLANRRFTGTFDNERIREILDILAVSLQLNYVRRDSVFILMPEPGT